MNRHKFMKLSGGANAPSAIGGRLAPWAMAAERAAPDAGAIFKSKDPAVMKLTP